MTMTKLVCADCRYENEPERVYCHNCGAKLDRSVLVKERQAAEDDTAQSRAHLQKVLRPGRGRWKRAIAEFFKLLVGAACLAAVIVMILPPESQAPAPNALSLAPMINMDLATALENHRPVQLTYYDAEVSSYLAGRLRRPDSPAKEGFFPLSRISVGFAEGSCDVNIERQFLGLSIFAGNTYRVSVSDGKISGESLGGYIGRMPIHPALMKPLGAMLFSKAWEALAQERKDVARLAGIEFHSHSVRLIVTP